MLITIVSSVTNESYSLYYSQSHFHWRTCYSSANLSALLRTILPVINREKVARPVMQNLIIITPRQRSCGIVMFSLLSVCSQGEVGGSPCDYYPWCIGPHCTGPQPSLDIRPPSLPDIRPPAPWDIICETCSNLFAWGPIPSPVLTSGGHWSTYGWQASGTHPTGMLSC